MRPERARKPTISNRWFSANFRLALTPLVRAIPSEAEHSTWLRPISNTLRVIGAFLPGTLSVWFNAYARDPGHFLVSATTVIVLTYISSVVLGGRISDNMRGIWRSTLAVPSHTRWGHIIFRLRTSHLYQLFHSLLKRHIAPAFFAIIFVYAGLALASHVIFDFEDSAGLICRNSVNASRLDAGQTSPPIRFSTSNICQGTGVLLERGVSYLVTVKQVTPWRDGSINTTVGGFYSSDLPWNERLIMFLGVPLKRTLIRPWFRVILRVGTTGNEEDFLDPDGRTPDVLEERYLPPASGELFFYVNDAVLATPGMQSIFYDNNVGEAVITIHRH
jgi:hypothetical protein